MKNKEYSANSIQVLNDLEAIRKRPGMYIGPTNEIGLHHLVWEILDNSIDEVMANFATEIHVKLLASNKISISDNGRGIPIEINPKTKKTTIDTVFTVLHAGAKFNSDNYEYSGGLHGVGSSVVNALSKSLTIITNWKKQAYSIKYHNGGQVLEELTKIGKANNKGTVVEFEADPSIFSTTVFDSQKIYEKIELSSFLFPNIKFTFQDADQIHTFVSKKGLFDYLSTLNKDKKQLIAPFIYEDKKENIKFQIIFQYLDNQEESIHSFVNGIKTKQGGSHENGFKESLIAAFNFVVKKNNKRKAIEISDFKGGLLAIISVNIPEKFVMFESQTKQKLHNKKIEELIFSLFFPIIKQKFLDEPQIVENIQKKILENQNIRLLSKQIKENKQHFKQIKNQQLLAGKLTPAQKNDNKINELFIVEGDSAGGSAKLCRNKKFQAILPLRGKILNIEKSKKIDILKNEEILSIISALGCGWEENINLKNLKYNKVIIMTDADDDGAHIQALLLTFFFSFFKPLIQAGNLYLANPPLYQIIKKNTSFYAWSEKELQNYQNKLEDIQIRRFKGLGEMNADQLWDTTMNPETRQLIQVNLEENSIKKTYEKIKILMGENAQLRKIWINENIDFDSKIKK